MLTIPEYAVAILREGYTQQGPEVEQLAHSPGMILPERMLVLDPSRLPVIVPGISRDVDRAVLLSLRPDPFGQGNERDYNSQAVEFGMSVLTVEDSTFFGLNMKNLLVTGDRVTVPMCPERHADLLAGILQADAIIVGHDKVDMEDGGMAVQLLAATSITEPSRYQMANIMISAMKGWPIPSLN